MGNTSTTNLDIDSFFEGETTVIDRITRVQLNLPREAVYRNKGKVKTVWIEATPNRIKVMTVRPKQEPRVVWAPKSHLRDFEVINPFSKNEKHVARWAGVGVLCIDALGIHITVFFEGDIDDPKLEFECSSWNQTPEAKKVLSADLGLGYDVLYLSGTDMKEHHLCEALDDRDDKPTKIFLPGMPKDLGRKRPRETTSPKPPAKKAKKK